MLTSSYDDHDGWIWLDDRLVPWRDAKLHVLSHGLHYASAVFEGERVYDREIFKLREHSERMAFSAKLMDFQLPCTVDALDAACREVVAANNIVDGYVRPIAWRSSEMMGISAQKAKIRLAIACWEWPTYFTPEERMKGIRMNVADFRRPSPDMAPVHSKATGLYMICTLSKHAAEAAGYADALMLDWRGQIAEATGANIFLVQNGVIHTPTPDTFLDGITRQTVIELARKRGIEVVERAIMPEELSQTDEVLLTGTAVEVTPVSEIAEYRFTPGSVTETMMKDFDALVRAVPSKTKEVAAD